jgi:hypothetical protein
MNVQTGELVRLNDGDVLPDGHIAVKRELTAREKYDMKVKLYSPCGCGSGKKFKFCCYRKQKKMANNG